MAKRQIVRIDADLCTGCGECVPACAEGALEILDGKVRVIEERLCDGLGACLGQCPVGALSVEEREADEFDEIAVERRLLVDTPGGGSARGPLGAPSEEAAVSLEPLTAHGCPGSLSRVLAEPGRRPATSPEPERRRDSDSLLVNWPVQLGLANPYAPLFRDADLLVAADCVPSAYRLFHEDFLQGRTLLIACPKLDEVQPHLEKLAELLRVGHPRSVTVVRMEVPCCFGLVRIVQAAAEKAEFDGPVHEVVVRIDGGVETGLKVPSS